MQETNGNNKYTIINTAVARDKQKYICSFLLLFSIFNMKQEENNSKQALVNVMHTYFLSNAGWM